MDFLKFKLTIFSYMGQNDLVNVKFWIKLNQTQLSKKPLLFNRSKKTLYNHSFWMLKERLSVLRVVCYTVCLFISPICNLMVFHSQYGVLYIVRAIFWHMKRGFPLLLTTKWMDFYSQNLWYTMFLLYFHI